jgi:hypothetical protein
MLSPTVLGHLPAMHVIGPILGTTGAWIAIVIAMTQHRKAKPEERMKPRIRNGRIG